MRHLLLWIGIGSITCHLVSGLTLTSNSSIKYTTGFTLVCDVQGPITTSLTINDPGGSPAVSCFAPPNPCGSSVSNTYNRDIAGGTLTVNIIQSNVDTTNSVGSWTCSDGTLSATHQVSDIVSFREPVVWAASAEDGATVTMKFECIFPYPDEIKIEYVKASDRNSVLKTETGVTFTNGTASNCPVADARAISVEGTFTLSNSGLTESADVKVTAYLNGIALSSGYSNFTIVSTPTPDECPLFQYAFWPCFSIILVVALLVIAVSYCVGKKSKLQEGSLKKKCGCFPSDNTFCMAVCPLCTDALCTGSNKIAKNVISVVVFLIVAAVIGVAIAFGLGVDSGKCILALILSIICGLALGAIFTVSVYPHWPCLPEKGQDGRNCFNACRIVPKEETKKTDENDSGKKKPKKKTDENDSGKKKPKKEPAENQASPNRETPRSPQASASGIQLMTAEGKNPREASPRPLPAIGSEASPRPLPAIGSEASPRPLPAIGSEAKQPPPTSYEESTLKNKQLGAPLPKIPNKLPPVDTVNNEEDKPKKKKEKKKNKEKDKNKAGGENVEDDKRDSQNSGGQANVEEEEQK